jgi:hypothetical protein
MTELTSKELLEVGKAINNQFLNLKSKGKEEQVTLFGSPKFLIRSSSSKYHLRLVNLTDLGITSWPDWIDADINTTDTIISIPHNRTAHLEYLLRITWEDYSADLAQPFQKSFLAQLRAIVKVWEMGSELMDRDAQRGLIGEIQAVILCTEVLKNNDAIDSWDETSRERVDITHKNWAVEAKSKAPQSKKSKSNTVKISSSEQLCRDKTPLILSVTDISSDKKGGMTLPEWANKRLDDLSKSVPHSNIDKFRKKMDKIHQIFKMKEYFESKWKIGTTEFFEIEVGSIPDSFGKDIPYGISIPGYTLNLKVLKSEQVAIIFASI